MSNWACAGRAALLLLFHNSLLSRLLLCLAALFAAAPAAASGERWQWSRVDLGSIAAVGVDSLSAVAIDEVAGRVALGHSRGVAIAEVASTIVQPARGAAPPQPPALEALARPFRLAARLRPVTDLHFDAESGLWIATLDGLWYLSREGVLQDRSPSPGEAARRVRRVLSSGAFLATATDSGAFVSFAGRSWRALNGAVPVGPVTALALETLEGDTARVWLALPQGLWRVLVRIRAGEAELSAERVRWPPELHPELKPLELRVGESPFALAVLFPGLLTVLSTGENATGVRPIDWKVHRPVLPPGAELRRMIQFGDRVWLASDRGLLSAPSLHGPWQRAAPPVGTAAIRAVAGVGHAGAGGFAADELWAVGERGLFRGRRVAERSLPVRSHAAGERDAPGVARASETPIRGPELPPREPSIREVHLRVLNYSGLAPDYLRSLRRGLRRRALLPDLRLVGGYSDDRERRRDSDESFVSGQTRHLRDRQFQRGRDWDLLLSFDWQLSDLAYDPESIELSREARQVIALRDDVLDEINQLFFERRALLQQLAGESPLQGAEADRAQLRADELTAGLDAWTGGWFGERLKASSAAALPPPP